MTKTLAGIATAYEADVDSGAGGGHVFVSYSRKDYYFAESLAFHLEREGVPAWLDARQLTPGADWAQGIEAALAASRCVVLVVSPDSVYSPHVRTEWKRALANGRRVILAVFRAAAIPDDLSSAETVDFRGRFRRGVRTLVAVVSGESRPATRPRLHRAVIPPNVALITMMLAILWIGFMAAGIAFADLGNLNFWEYVVIAAIHGLVLYHIGLAFLRRRMSMSRLAVCFGIYGFVFGYPLLEVIAGPAVPHLYPAGMVQFARDHWMVESILLGITASGLITLSVLRPADLLRWAPTGKAWSTYRRWHYRVPADYDPSGAQVLTRINAFRIVCDTPDEPAGEELRRRLTAAGIRQRDDSSETTAVLLLTNRTRLTWLLDQLKTLPASMITFVGSGLHLREEFNELWRRQWVDARSWRVLRDHRPLQKRERGAVKITLPALPEALTRTILPSHVSRANHLSMSFGMLLIAIAFAMNPKEPDTVGSVTDAVKLVLTLLSWSVAAVWLRASHQLVVRGISERMFYGTVRRLAPAIVVLGLIDLGFYWKAGGHPVRVALCTSALLVATIVLPRMRSGLQSWFPSIPREPYDVSLAPARAWRRTALLALVHLMLWMSVLNPDT